MYYYNIILLFYYVILLYYDSIMYYHIVSILWLYHYIFIFVTMLLLCYFNSILLYTSYYCTTHSDNSTRISIGRCTKTQKCGERQLTPSLEIVHASINMKVHSYTTILLPSCYTARPLHILYYCTTVLLQWCTTLVSMRLLEYI